MKSHRLVLMLRILGAACVIAAIAAVPSAASAATAAKSASELTIPFLADMGPPDPDVFYSSEGLAVDNALYEGLLQYKLNNTNAVAPLLATSWSISPDAMTYTFNLRAGVKFHDGTPFTSSAAVASFKRRLAVNGGPAYMLDAVASTATPNDLTFVVHLKHPVSAFLSYLASPYGPRMMSPTVLTDHAGKDEAQTWLQTHDAGTGPYTISSWRTNQEYTLQRFADYWGPAPAVATIRIPIVPDILPQQVELSSGEVDMIVHGLTPQQVAPFAGKPEVHRHLLCISPGQHTCNQSKSWCLRKQQNAGSACRRNRPSSAYQGGLREPGHNLPRDLPGINAHGTRRNRTKIQCDCAGSGRQGDELDG